jgi:hypothetical protein
MADAASTPTSSSFAAGFPEDARLRTLLAAFERGDYRAVRQLGPKLEQAARADGETELAEAAAELCRRTTPDPTIRLLLLISALLLLGLALWSYSNQGAH